MLKKANLLLISTIIGGAGLYDLITDSIGCGFAAFSSMFQPASLQWKWNLENITANKRESPRNAANS
ncbi:MAG: hypothetical protein JAZ05_04045, partial [Candidatus Thiodiazotropha taylori]|nr:hypothetical protein [Candidatus Thiodiazotropha taylori]MCW4291182.1 hypothetical protein [Candidatus Thiodiazotropha taylori]